MLYLSLNDHINANRDREWRVLRKNVMNKLMEKNIEIYIHFIPLNINWFFWFIFFVHPVILFDRPGPEKGIFS